MTNDNAWQICTPINVSDVRWIHIVRRERNGRIGAPVSHWQSGTRPTSYSCNGFIFLPCLSPIASLSTTGARHLRTNYTPSRPHCLPPFPFRLLFVSLFPSLFFVLRHRRSALSCSHAAPVRPQYSPQPIFSILLTFFLYVRCNGDAYTFFLHDTAPFSPPATTLEYPVGTFWMYLDSLLACQGWHWPRQSQCVPFLSFSFACVFVIFLSFSRHSCLTSNPTFHTTTEL